MPSLKENHKGGTKSNALQDSHFFSHIFLFSSRESPSNQKSAIKIKEENLGSCRPATEAEVFTLAIHRSDKVLLVNGLRCGIPDKVK